MLVTTVLKESALIVRKAMRFARLHGFPYQSRDGSSIAELMERCVGRGVFVVGKHEVRYWHDDERSMSFHPSMAMLRIKRMKGGETDPLVLRAKVTHGDQILDCTAGLGSDAIVLSFAAGETGNVTALESAVIPYALLHDGLSSYRSDVPELNAALQRIRVHHADYLQKLCSLPDNSYDVVYFDPMFTKPVRESAAIQPLRTVADGKRLSVHAVREAARVARKTVVFKEHIRSGEFERLGFSQVYANQNLLAYGVIAL